MNKRRYLLPLLLLLLQGCDDDALNNPLDTGDHIPGLVSNVRTEPTPGGAIIRYDIPEDNELLYVKAEYAIREGLVRETKSSYYKKSLEISGFPDTRPYEVKLYSVSKSEKVSDPVIVNVTPLSPPVVEISKTFELFETFGGVRLNFHNDAESDVALVILADDGEGALSVAETFYTKKKEGTFAARGFDATTRRFGAYVRDRWDNHSDTLFAELTPLPEKLVDKSKFKAVNLPTDTYESHCCGNGLVSLWDNQWNNGTVFHTKPGTGLPQWFTIDLGVQVNLSRFKFYHRLGGSGRGSTDGAYTGADPRSFEIWGSNAPATDGSWESWVKLGDFESVKPSGPGAVTTEDFEFAVVNGEDFDFPEGIPAVRYLRWKTNRVWGTLDHVYMAELTFWGNFE